MAILCSRCGREYDVTLFQFGRTIHCTCGARVGREQRVALSSGDASPGAGRKARPRFVADSMLGGLARWLRILGYDVAYDTSLDDGALVRLAVREGRRLLTRDRRLPEEWRVEGVVVVEAEDPVDQLREVVARLGLDPDEERAFSRCPVCNGELESADPSDVRGRVPARVLGRHEEFLRCPACGKVYWEGGHVRRMRRRVDDLLG